MKGKPGLSKLTGLSLIGLAFASLFYALYSTGYEERIGSAESRERLTQNILTEELQDKSFSPTPGPALTEDELPYSGIRSDDVGNSAALVERLFSLRYEGGLREQKLTVNGCDVVVADVRYNAKSGAPERQELSRFQLGQFHIVESDAPDRLLLAADAGADQDLLLWYDALEEATGLDEEDLVQTLLHRADAGDFGPFVARNRHQTQTFSSDGTVGSPFPRPLLQASLRLPQGTAPKAMAAWRDYVDEHCPSG